MRSLDSGGPDLAVGRVLRSRNQLWFAWLFGGFFGLLGLAEVVRPAQHGYRGLGAVMIVVSLGIIALFAVRTGLWITEAGIRVRNPFSSYKLAWTEIRAFRIGRHGFFGSSLLIDAADGSTRYAFAVQVANVSLSNPHAPERTLVAELNAALEAKRTAAD